MDSDSKNNVLSLQQITIMTVKALIFFFTITFSVSAFAQNAQGELKVRTNSAIDRIVDGKIAYNKNLKTVKGFKIQLFYGSEKGAYETKEKFEKLFPEIPAKLSFSTPDWKIQVGNYYNRLQADQQISEIKNDFPGAIIVATEIDLPEKIK